MPTKRRVILSGTPIQNDLQEFYYIMDVVNPGIMGNLNAFKRIYEKPINQSRERNCKPSIREEGDARAKELSRRCNMFILRRKSDILIPYLPPKVEQVLFCRLSDVQIKLYHFFLESRSFMAEMMESSAYAFSCIQLMGKLCNHPNLIYDKIREEFPEALDLFGEDFDPKICNPIFSGKFQAIDRILKVVRESGKDNKVVVVSNFTKTLDVLEKLFKQRNYLFLRLDGSTDSSKRMKLVERFNSSHTPEFIFLLSSKAGGVGLNLIGGNRLILVDPDWNPATDEQAMARIWREGQPKPVWIYRMISTGTIEEKIYQRQMRKLALSRSIVDESMAEKRNFTSDELKRLFELNLSTSSETHDLIRCDCSTKIDIKSKIRKNDDFGVTFSEDDGWKHYNDTKQCLDPAIVNMNNQFTTSLNRDDKLISFVFALKTKDISDLPKPKVKEIKETVEYLGYESDDFVKKPTKKQIKKSDEIEIEEDIDIKENIDDIDDIKDETDIDIDEISETKSSSRPKRLTRLKKKEPIDLLEEEDEEMAALLNFSDSE